jgi:hypothetical protein
MKFQLPPKAAISPEAIAATTFGLVCCVAAVVVAGFGPVRRS